MRIAYPYELEDTAPVSTKLQDCWKQVLQQTNALIFDAKSLVCSIFVAAVEALIHSTQCDSFESNKREDVTTQLARESSRQEISITSKA